MKNNNIKPLLIILLLIFTASLCALDVTIGAGNQLNRKPFDFYYRYSLFETLYYPSELTTSGYIESITFYNNFPNSNYSSGHIQIWLGMTDLNDLSGGWIPSTQLTSVYNRSIYFPAGQNAITITLNSPYLYTGRNLVLMARTPGNSTWTGEPLNFYCQTIGTSRARDYYSNSNNADHSQPPMTGNYLSLSGQFPKTTFHFTDASASIDLGINSLTGPDSMVIGQSYTHNVTIGNFGTTSQSNYTVKLYGWNKIELASATGETINAGATSQIPINWIPNGEEGYSTIYAQVILTDDQNYFNDKSEIMDVAFYPETGGGVTPPNPIPNNSLIDMSYKTSLFETVFPTSYLAGQNVVGNRMISGLKFYNNFTDNIPNKPIKIWLGTTNQQDLATGWIPSNQLTLVYDGLVNFPSGSNTININLQTSYFYQWDNLVMMVSRPMDTVNYNGNNVFVCYTGNPNISRNAVSNTTVIDPTNPPAGSSSLSNIYPATAFICTFNTLGTLKGNVFNSLYQPIANVVIQLNYQNISTTTDANGSYVISWLLPGTYQVTVSAPGYVNHTQNVTISEAQSVILDFGLHSVADLIITGRVVRSDATSIGIADATVEIVGAVTNAVATDNNGYFTIYDVPANQSYIIRASHPTYMTYNCNVTMINQNVDIGNLPLDWDMYTSADNQVADVNTILYGCFPNPFSESTTVNYELKEPSKTTLEIYNIKGQKINTLANCFTKAGKYSITWDSTDNNGNRVASGIYYFKMSAGRYSATRKVILLK